MRPRVFHIGTIVRRARAKFSTVRPIHKLPLSEVKAWEVARSQRTPRTDWRYLSTGAQLRRGDITAPIRTLAEPAGHACTYCGEVYAPAGLLMLARVLEHLNACPDLARRRMARMASSDELVARALDGDR